MAAGPRAPGGGGPPGGRARWGPPAVIYSMYMCVYIYIYTHIYIYIYRERERDIYLTHSLTHRCQTAKRLHRRRTCPIRVHAAPGRQ